MTEDRDQDLERQRAYRRTRQAINGLPELSRQFVLAGYSQDTRTLVKEYAEECGLSEGAIKKLCLKRIGPLF